MALFGLIKRIRLRSSDIKSHSRLSKRLSSTPDRRLKLVFLTAILFAFVASIPQFHLLYIRGSQWNGSCAYSDPDELPYAAYVNALIDGRPRVNDPYSGRDGRFETLFSVQFLPAYAVALPARFFGLSSDSAFMLLLPLASVGAILSLWWLLFEITGNSMLAIVGAACVVSLGTAAAHSPLQILAGIESGYDPFPLLRRYIPAVPFSIFIANHTFMWRALTRNVIWAVWAGISFGLLIYSYYFLWTAAAAWLFMVIILWLIARPLDRPRVFKTSGILVVIGTTAFAPYFWVLANRPASIDRGQILELTHSPDLLRSPELYGALVFCLLIYFVIRRYKRPLDPKVLFTASFAMSPFVVFNQQIITGRSLQPFHYEEFAANYWIVISLVLTLGIFKEQISRRILSYLALAALIVGVMLSIFTVRLMGSSNVRLDEVRQAALTFNHLNDRKMVFASDRFLTNALPTVSENPVLWARYLYTFSNIDVIEQKKRYYQYLYYSGVDKDLFERTLHDDFTSRWEVFGPERVNPVLTASHKPISTEEIEAAANEYLEFCKSFDLARAASPLLSYAVVSPTDNLNNLDLWYERGPAENEGGFIIYPLKLRVRE